MAAELNIPDEVRNYVQKKLDEVAEKMNKKNLLEMKGILNKYFGEEYNQIVRPTVDSICKNVALNWDPQLRLSIFHQLELSSYGRTLYSGCHVIIRFPEVTITNGREDKNGKPTFHVIKDLWVKFYLTRDCGIELLEGARSTMTYNEASVGYLHSHLSSRTVDRTWANNAFGSFCTGTGEINQVIRILTVNGFDPINFTLFCLHLKNYVVWESLDGTPHIKYSTIRTGVTSESHNLPHVDSHVLNIKLNRLKREIGNIDIEVLRRVFNVYISGDSLKLAVTDELSIFLAGLISRIDGNGSSLLCKRTLNGEYYAANTRRNREINPPTEPLFYFKERPIYLTIENQPVAESSNEQNQTIYAHPTFTELFAESYSEEFSEVCYRNEDLIKSNTVSYFLQATGPNLLPL